MNEITLNGRRMMIKDGVLTYEDIVKLARGDKGDNPFLYTVTYRMRGSNNERSGSLTPSDDYGITVMTGLIITAMVTDNA